MPGLEGYRFPVVGALRVGCTVLFASIATSSTEPSWSPPKLLESTAPQPFGAADGELALFEVAISREGDVVEINDLAEGASFNDHFRGDISSWRFEPAKTEATGRVASHVLVAGVSRSPNLVGAFGPWPKTPESVEASEEIPYPDRVVVPPFPPQATREGIVLIEIDIDDRGGITGAKTVHSSNGYDDVCLDTARHWMFRPARHRGRAVATRAYLLCNFRPPPRPGMP